MPGSSAEDHAEIEPLDEPLVVDEEHADSHAGGRGIRRARTEKPPPASGPASRRAGLRTSAHAGHPASVDGDGDDLDASGAAVMHGQLETVLAERDADDDTRRVCMAKDVGERLLQMRDRPSIKARRGSLIGVPEYLDVGRRPPTSQSGGYRVLEGLAREHAVRPDRRGARRAARRISMSAAGGDLDGVEGEPRLRGSVRARWAPRACTTMTRTPRWRGPRCRASRRHAGALLGDRGARLFAALTLQDPGALDQDRLAISAFSDAPTCEPGAAEQRQRDDDVAVSCTLALARST